MKRTDHGHSQHWVQGRGWKCDEDCLACSQSTLFGDPKPVQPRFQGSDYVEPRDGERLTGQLLRVFTVMSDQQWRTVPEIRAEIVKRWPDELDPEASISAQIRNLRKTSFGAHKVHKQIRPGFVGLYEFSLALKG